VWWRGREEAGEDKRLGWWQSDLASPFSGMDSFRRLLPGTWEWAVLQRAREAVHRTDAEIGKQDHGPDRYRNQRVIGLHDQDIWPRAA
jgi:hypothetical protein